VLTGFKAGIALVIIADQLPKLFGLHIGRAPFFEKLGAFGAHLPETNGTTLLVALATLGLLLALEHGAPRIPAPLVAVVVGIAASGLLGLSRAGVDVVGTIPSGLPVPAIPDLSLAAILWPGALGIALMAFTETIATGRSFARPEDPRPSADRELVALGLANLGGSLFGGMPAGGGASQTAVNVKAGARTQVAGLVAVAMVGATLLFLAPLVGLMPQAVLAAIVVVTTMGLLSPAEFRAIAAVRGAEFRWALAALAGVVLLGTLNGILLAVAISVLALARQANHPRVYALRRKPGTDVFRPASESHPDDESIPGMLVVRAEGRMTFASAPRAGEHLWALVRAEQPRVLLLDCSAIPDFEYTALRMLANFERDLGSSGVALWLAALNPEALRVIERSGLGRTLGRERMYFTVEHAVAAHSAVTP
jgi:MFS superfamily sulfate permease-like transporter